MILMPVRFVGFCLCCYFASLCVSYASSRRYAPAAGSEAHPESSAHVHSAPRPPARPYVSQAGVNRQTKAAERAERKDKRAAAELEPHKKLYEQKQNIEQSKAELQKLHRAVSENRRLADHNSEYVGTGIHNQAQQRDEYSAAAHREQATFFQYKADARQDALERQQAAHREAQEKLRLPPIKGISGNLPRPSVKKDEHGFTVPE